MNTKEKIMKTALPFFAQKGVEGTSIREVAKKAKVNLAAINYHFKSKNGLFEAVMANSYSSVANDIRLLAEKCETLEELMAQIYLMFVKRGPELTANFKMLLSSPTSKVNPSMGTEDEFFGPPGGSVIYNFLKKEALNLKEEDYLWGMKVLFTHVIHVALVSHSPCGKNLGLDTNEGRADVVVGTRRLVRAVLFELKNINPADELFLAKKLKDEGAALTC